MLLRGLRGFDHADAGIDRAIGAARPFTRAVFDAEVEGIDLQALADFVHDGFTGEGGIGRTGRAIGRRRRLVDDNVIAVDVNVGNVIAGEDAHRPWPEWRAGKRAGLVSEVGPGRDELAVPVGAHLHLDVRAGRRTGRLEDVGPVHGDLDRLARLPAQSRRDGFEIDANLAAEAAANLHRHDLDA